MQRNNANFFDPQQLHKIFFNPLYPPPPSIFDQVQVCLGSDS
jgi:hypothetical protein